MALIKTISESSINALRSGQTIRDDKLKGFCARYRSKFITYFVHTRINGRMTFFKIGYHGSPWKPHEARTRAAEILRDISLGIDPRAIINDPDNALSFEEIFERFIAAKQGHVVPRTIENYRQLARTHIIPYFKNRPMNSLSRADIIAFHTSIRHVPRAANHALVLLSGVFTWAQIEGLRKNLPNPCMKIKKYKSNHRARFLTIDDLRRLADALRWALSAAEATPTQVAAILAIMFTGARRNEIFSLKRSYVDRHRMIAHLPKSKTGRKVIPLNPHAMAILDGLPEVPGNPYYFVGRFEGTCITDIKRPWDKIRKRANLDKFRIHDLRHSFASFAADGGASALAVGEVLGHGSIETTKIYLHLFNNRARETSTTAASAIHAALTSAHADAASASHSGPQDRTSPLNDGLSPS